MKILITSDTYENQICGVYVSITTLKDQLIKQGHDVRLLTLSKDHKSKIVNNDYYIGSFSLYRIDFRQSIKFNDKIIDEIISWNPDLIHVQTEWFCGKISKKISKKTNCPYINTCHTSWEDFTSGLIPTKILRRIISKRIVKKCYNESYGIIAPSEKMISYLKKININLPTYIIPTGIDLERFNQKLSPEKENKLKSELNLNDNSKILVYLGRIAKEKNIEELIEFLPDLILKDKDIILLICGEGPDLNHLKNKITKMGMQKHVRFTGVIHPKETYKYYKLGKIFVSASTCETQGITYIEALASSLPIVCRYDESLDDVIENGYNGFTYTNKQEYIDHILKILNMDEEYSILKDNALKASQKFSKETFGKDIESVYLNTLNNL
ncbi:glycosyltransferase [uncultured Methanobrevibacter sp.]|uniref:glycosyltransferase n=1 Tax=uncultured Methanobrevibacter sp. TaxID=253161 RepID=UPI0025DC54C3|nr:glycosyltransferase [uncultured Methanobrevibacter sp.]